MSSNRRLQFSSATQWHHQRPESFLLSAPSVSAPWLSSLLSSSGYKAAAKTSGVTILCRRMLPPQASPSISNKTVSKATSRSPSNLTGRNWITCPPPTVMPKRWDQRTGRACHPWRHQCLTPEKLGILLLRKRRNEVLGRREWCLHTTGWPAGIPCSRTGGLGQRPCLNEELGILQPQQAKDTAHS